MSTSVWLFKPRSHGRKKEGARARNGAPLPGRLPGFRLPHRSASSALCPCGHAASFRRRASSFVRGVWCLEFGGAASGGGGAMRVRAVCAARSVAYSCAVLLRGCGCCCGGVCVATLTSCREYARLAICALQPTRGRTQCTSQPWRILTDSCVWIQKRSAPRVPTWSSTVVLAGPAHA